MARKYRLDRDVKIYRSENELKTRRLKQLKRNVKSRRGRKQLY